jgi:serine/threonine protein kinase
LDHFKIVHMIGLGGFSKVFLARNIINNKFYALKMIEKQFILKNGKKDIIMGERQILIDI